jgi:hypothetical protein
MPRPSAAPRAVASIQAAVYSQSASDSRASAKYSASPPKRMSSASTASPATRRSRSRARRISPVRPRPPMVAANSSGCCCAEQHSTRPSLRARSSATTWRPKLPKRWWFLPCTSWAMAPPTVTKRVPGVTGSSQPPPSGSGRHSTARMSASCTPASQASTPLSRSNAMKRSRPRQSTSRPCGLSGASPYERPLP